MQMQMRMMLLRDGMAELVMVEAEWRKRSSSVSSGLSCVSDVKQDEAGGGSEQCTCHHSSSHRSHYASIPSLPTMV